MRKAFLISGVIFLHGCVSSSMPAHMKSVSVTDIVTHIQCEIYQSSLLHPSLRKDGWVAAVALTFQTDASGALAPTASFGHVANEVGTAKFSGGLGFTKTTSKLFTENFLIDVAKIESGTCEAPISTRTALSGDLGIEHSVNTALSSMRPERFSSGLSFAKERTFAQTVKFTIDMRVTALGPTWNLERFIGPAGLLSAYRTDIHTLDIAFAQKETPAVSTVAPKAAQSTARKAIEALQQIQIRQLDVK